MVADLELSKKDSEEMKSELKARHHTGKPDIYAPLIANNSFEYFLAEPSDRGGVQEFVIETQEERNFYDILPGWKIKIPCNLKIILMLDAKAKRLTIKNKKPDPRREKTKIIFQKRVFAAREQQL